MFESEDLRQSQPEYIGKRLNNFWQWYLELLGCFSIRQIHMDGNSTHLFKAKIMESIPQFQSQFEFVSAGSSISNSHREFPPYNKDKISISSSFAGVADGCDSTDHRIFSKDSKPLEQTFAGEILARCRHLIHWRKQNKSVADHATRDRLRSLGVVSHKSTEDHQQMEFSFIRSYLTCAISEVKCIGNASLCICAINEGRLHIATVGDSGLFVFRLLEDSSRNVEYQIIIETRPNLTKNGKPWKVSNKRFLKGKKNNATTPGNLAVEHFQIITEKSLEIEDGDVVISGTNGFLENIKVTEIQECLNHICKPSVPKTFFSNRLPLKNPQDVARKLIEIAHQNREQPTQIETMDSDGDFSDSWRTLDNKIVTGGVDDDMSVIVSYVKEKSTFNEYQSLFKNQPPFYQPTSLKQQCHLQADRSPSAKMKKQHSAQASKDTRSEKMVRQWNSTATINRSTEVFNSQSRSTPHLRSRISVDRGGTTEKNGLIHTKASTPGLDVISDKGRCDNAPTQMRESGKTRIQYKPHENQPEKAKIQKLQPTNNTSRDSQLKSETARPLHSSNYSFVFKKRKRHDDFNNRLPYWFQTLFFSCG